jgi:hypothetical protein
MALPVIANISRTVLEWSGPGGSTAANVLHFSNAGDPVDLFNAIDDAWSRNMLAWVSDTAVINRIAITPLDGTSGAQEFVTAGDKWAGLSGGEPIPQVAGLIKLSTGFRGPANRGRVFLPFISEAAQSNGQMAATGDPGGAWAGFVVAMIASLTPLGVASYVHANWHAVGGATAELRSGTQRRRQRR